MRQQGGLRGVGMADPAQHLLGAVGGGGGEAAGLQFGQRDALLVGEVVVAGPEDGPADGLGELSAARLGLAHLVDGGGEDLDDVEPVDGDGGVGEAGGECCQEGWRHVADDLGHTDALSGMTSTPRAAAAFAADSALIPPPSQPAVCSPASTLEISNKPANFWRALSRSTDNRSA